jgi:hypothetical protein
MICFATFLLLTQVDCSVQAPLVQSKTLTSEIWIASPDHLGEVGSVNTDTGAVKWRSIPSTHSAIHDAIQSRTGKYLAVTTNEGVQIFGASQPTRGNEWQLTPLRLFPEYAKAIWSPDSDEILLMPKVTGGLAVWNPALDSLRKSLPSEMHICSARWGTDSGKVIVSQCFGQRRIVVWQIDNGELKTLIHFSLKLQNKYIIHAFLHGMSPDKKYLLVEFRIRDQDLTGRETDMPIVQEYQFAFLEVETGRYQLLPEQFIGTQSEGVWLSSAEVLTIGTSSLRLPVRFTYQLADVSTGTSRPVLSNDDECLMNLTRIQSTIFVQYSHCQDGHLSGLYEFDVQAGTRKVVPNGYRGEWYMLSQGQA